ncbi:MAG: T9SS type A sorting domain-containing protein, partial [Bacteroidales bacterium]|nr:T9SS type A sorting domain-containing protein [Bacteroidales bacterium]
RTYRLHLPVDYNPDSLYPLVINMHGLGSNAFEQEIYTEFNNVADTSGFIVSYPNGISETWNIASSTGTDDVGFISALIDTINYLYGVDLQRVYATGMSMGGFMSYRLACELSDRIAAIASVTGLQAFYPCDPGRSVPVAQFHGTADPVVPYAGVATTINNWVNYNYCPETPVTTDLPDIDPDDNSTVTVSYYGLCDDSTEVILYSIINGEHTWPGASIYIGITNQDIKASNEIWAFFRKYTLQGSTNIEEGMSITDLECRFFPNPVKGLATVEFTVPQTESVDFRIIDVNGKICLEEKSLNNSRFLIDCSQIPQGFYFVELSSGNRKSYQKIVIQ